MSDDSSKKPPKDSPEDSGDSGEELPELSEEDIFLKTKVGSPSETEPHEESHDELPEISEADPFEPIESFENLEQSVPAFEPIELPNESPLNDELSSQNPEQNQPFTPEFSASGSVAPSEPTSKTIDSIKNYSESLNAEASAAAPLPFTLRIEGKLTPQEAEKLLDVLSREKMDIREVDLEPQFEAGRVLIPRISEYAGVMLIQALRGVRAKIYFQPSDIDSGALSDSAEGAMPADFNESFTSVEAAPSAESLPVTQGDDLPQLGIFHVIDTLIVSGMLSTRSVEALNSNEFTTLTESLMRELKFKAVRRGARGITHLSIQLTPLTLPTDYRVTLSGTAVS